MGESTLLGKQIPSSVERRLSMWLLDPDSLSPTPFKSTTVRLLCEPVTCKGLKVLISVLHSKKMKALESLIGMIQKFPYDDPTYDRLHEDLDRIRAKFRQVCPCTSLSGSVSGLLSLVVGGLRAPCAQAFLRLEGANSVGASLGDGVTDSGSRR